MALQNTKTALVAGATGLVGSELLHVLLNNPYYLTVITLTRRPLNLSHPRLLQIVTDFDKLNEFEMLIGATDVYCCLGTTMKKAGSKAAFKLVDYEYPLQLAQLAHKNQCQHYLLVSSMGASAKSVLFYNQVKGQVEDGLQQIPFQRLSIFQPSLLLGKREEHRPTEAFAQRTSKALRFALQGGLKKYRPIQANTVAQAMFQVAQQPQTGINTYTSNQIEALAG